MVKKDKLDIFYTIDKLQSNDITLYVLSCLCDKHAHLISP